MGDQEGRGGDVSLLCQSCLGEATRPKEITHSVLAERLNVGFEDAAIGMTLLDVDMTWIRVNRTFANLLGYSPEELVGRSFQAFTHPDDLAVGPRALGAAAQSRHHVVFEKRLLHLSGRVIWVEIHLSMLRCQHGQALGYFSQVIDATPKRRLADELSRRALYDAVTGFPNRSLFTDRLEQLSLASRDQGTECQLVVASIGIHGLSTIGTLLGPAAEEQAAKEVARRLAAAVPTATTIGRLAQDEFAILLPCVPCEVGSLVENVLDAASQPWSWRGTEMLLQATAGVLSWNYRHKDASAAVRDASLARQQAMPGGRDRVVTFAAVMRAAAVERSSLEAQLRRAIDGGELFLEYQPIVALDTREVVGAEALVRWQHPTRGVLPPASFIELAEHSRLIVDLGRWVLNEATRAARSWNGRWVSVNLSPMQFQDPGLLRSLSRALKAAKLPPDLLILEVTEGMLVEELEANFRLLQDIKSMGVRLALDDFGTGYSSLSYLERLPVDVLKLDRAFVTGLAVEDSRRAGLVGVVSHLGDLFGLRVVAEGIENEAELASLVKLGYRYGQGYLLGRPGSEAQMWARLGIAPPHGARPSRFGADPVSH